MNRSTISLIAASAATAVALAACTPVPPGPTTTTSSTTTTTVDRWVTSVGECWAASSATPGVINLDVRYLGPRDQPDNLAVYDSADGSCTGSPSSLDIVQAPDATAAETACNALPVRPGLPVDVVRMTDLWPAAISDAWLCQG